MMKLKTPSERFLLWATVLFGVAVALVAYVPTIGFAFVADDAAYIEYNFRLQSLPGAEVWKVFVLPYNELGELLPLRDLFFWAELKLFGLNPAAFRALNILLYLLSLPLLFSVTVHVWRSYAPHRADDATLAAACVVCLFAVNPALVESVVYIAGRKYILANFLSILTLWLALRARQADRLSGPLVLASVGGFVLVMLTKTSYIPVAVVVAMLWVDHAHRSRNSHAWRIAIAGSVGLAAAGAFLLYRFIAVVYSGGIDSVDRVEPIGLSSSIGLLGWLLRLSTTFEDRHHFYPVIDGSGLPLMIGLGVAVLVASALSAWRWWRAPSIKSFAVLAFVLLCLPYLSLQPFSSPSVIQDRYVSLAIWPVILLLVSAAWRLRPVVRILVFFLIALPWAVQTAQRSADWLSFENLVRIDNEAFPGYYVPIHYQITAQALPTARFGDAAASARTITHPEARSVTLALVRATEQTAMSFLSGDPGPAMASLWNEGQLVSHFPEHMRNQGPFALARTRSRHYMMLNWKDLVARFPRVAAVRYNAGLWMLQEGHVEEAVENYSVAVRLPDLPEANRGTAYRNLGLALLYGERVDEAEDAFRMALLQKVPDQRAYCGLVRVHEKKNRPAERRRAEDECRTVVDDSGKAASRRTNDVVPGVAGSTAE